MRTILGALYRAIDILSIVFLVLLVLLVFGQVVFRYASVPSPWTEELARFAFVYITFLGSILALRSNTHIEIDVLLNLMSPRLRHWVRALTHLLIVAFLYYFIQGCVLTIRTSGNVRSSSLLWFKMNYIFIIVLASAICMAVISAFKTIEHIRLSFAPNPEQGETRS